MGASYSKVHSPPLVNEKLVVERLRAMQVKDAEEVDSFVHVEKEKSGAEQAWRHQETTLSTSDVGAWEAKLLADPKNRFVIPDDSSLEEMLSDLKIGSYGTELCRPKDCTHIPLGKNCGPTDLQCQDPFRRSPNHEPEI